MNEETTVPAGASEQELVSNPVVNAPGPISSDEADDRLMALDKPKETKPSDEPSPNAATGETEADTRAKQPEEPAGDMTGEQKTAEGETEGEGDDAHAEGEPDPLEFEKLQGSTKLRLRDGTEITVGDIKKKWGSLQELERAQGEQAARERQFSQWANQQSQQFQQFEQRVQQFEQAAPIAIEVLRQSLPEIPDLPPITLRDEDRWEYDTQVDNRNRAIAEQQETLAKIDQIDQQLLDNQRQRDEHTQRELQQFIGHQSQKLMQIVPRLRDPNARQKFQSDYFSYGREKEFTDQELNGTFDARLLSVFDDVISLRAENAELKKKLSVKPTPDAKTKGQTAPLAKPGPMRSEAETAAANRQKELERVRNKGSISEDEADALIMKLGL